MKFTSLTSHTPSLYGLRIKGIDYNLGESPPFDPQAVLIEILARAVAGCSGQQGALQV